MAVKKGILGNYATYWAASLTMSAANALTYEKIESGMSIYDRIGWVLSRVEWMVPVGTRNLLLDQSDEITMGLATSNSMATISDTDPNVLSRLRISVADFGTAANSLLIDDPIVQDYTGLPGGGLLVLPNPLYVFMDSESVASAGSIAARAWFTSVDLSDEDYFLLAQARMLLNQ